MKFTAQLKLLIVSLIVASTFFYSYYFKQKYSSFEEGSNKDQPILANLPAIKLKLFDSEESINTAQLTEGVKQLIVHFWGTWCAPCKTEFPELVKLGQKFEGERIQFLLIAVNDQEVEMKKFLSRFKFPPNMIIAFDPDGSSMRDFGTVKVPETYFFNEKGLALKKFIGAQDWENSYFESVFRKALSADQL